MLLKSSRTGNVRRSGWFLYHKASPRNKQPPCLSFQTGGLNIFGGGGVTVLPVRTTTDPMPGRIPVAVRVNTCTQTLLETQYRHYTHHTEMQTCRIVNDRRPHCQGKRFGLIKRGMGKPKKVCPSRSTDHRSCQFVCANEGTWLSKRSTL